MASRVQGHIEFSFEPYWFHGEATEVNKKSLNLLPEMMFFFPETPYKRLGYKSNLMSASAMRTSFLLKNYSCGPG